MKEKTAQIFSIVQDNPCVSGCTISRNVHDSGRTGVSYFSLAAQTDISAETYKYKKLLFLLEGDLQIFTNEGQSVEGRCGDIIILPQSTPVGVKTKQGCIYTEISLYQEGSMNQLPKAGEVVKLAQLVPYQEGRIVNMDIISGPTLKFVVMSFDGGTGLAEHAAPGEALIFALEGKGIIGYEGKEYPIQAGENFKFAKNGKHYIKADEKFKMALLLTLE
ncbi:MAG: cupin domain-containing protein [Elusimicrobiaceae bacterium]|nr:cupin domain-containing protein [Elusimicrobiaceae bacterium]